MSDKRLLMTRQAIIAGETQRARQMVTALAKQLPDNPDVYYYAAFVARDRAHAEQMLARALALDEFHSGANRLHYQMGALGFEAARAETPAAPRGAAPLNTASVPVVREADLRARRRGRWWRNMPRGRVIVFALSAVTLSLSSGWLLMLMLGVGAQVVNPVASLVGAPQPIVAYDGLAITEYANPAELDGLVPSYNTVFGRGEAGTTGDILRDGAMHEYALEARSGEELAIAVQFFSPFAENVPSNVAILDPAGNLAGARCQRDYILDQYTGVVFICNINLDGEWRVRIFGKERESSGVYVVTADKFTG